MKHLANVFAASAVFGSIALAEDLHQSASPHESGDRAAFEHMHFTERGTPVAHSFGIEPAFTGRDLFLDHTYRKGDGVTEQETELELEWAFDRRFGVIVELPYIREDKESVGSASGFGDLAIVPRALLFEGSRFFATAQLEAVLPTGSSTFGGETAIAPGIAMWSDLGNWFTLNSNISIEHGFDSDSTELLFGFGLVKSFGVEPTDTGHDRHGHNHHLTTGFFHLHLEITGATPLTGIDKGDIQAEGLVGMSYGLAQGMDIRLGYLFPITSTKDFDHGLTGGMIFHF